MYYYSFSVVIYTHVCPACTHTRTQTHTHAHTHTHTYNNLFPGSLLTSSMSLRYNYFRLNVFEPRSHLLKLSIRFRSIKLWKCLAQYLCK